MEEQVIFGYGSCVNSSGEVKLEEDEEDFRSCCEDEDELKEREETAKEGSKNNLDDVSVNMFFKGVSIAEAGDCGAGVSGIGVVIERSANFPSIQVQKKLDFFVDESVADYLALMDGLLEAAQNKIMRVFAFTDSEILYDQSLSGKGLCRVSTNTPSYLHRLLRRSSDDHPPLSYRSSTITIVVEVSYLPAYITRNTMQDFIGSVCRSLVFKPSDAGGVFGGFVEKIGSIIRKPGIGLFSKPPVPALPPIAKSDAINVKKDDAFGRVYMGLKEKRHFKEKMQQQSKKDETKWKPLVRNRALKPSSLQLCMQMNEPDSNFGSKIWDPVGSDNTGSVNIWDYSDSEAAPASSWSTLPNRSLLCRPLPVDIGRCTCVIVKEALPEGLDGGNLYSLYTNTNKIRVELEEKQKQHARLLVLVLVLAIGVGVMKKMKEKDEQIQRMGKLNWVLQERVKSLYVENQLWRDLVKIERQRANAAHLELEKERLAAATAAEDIMAMILKLQNEKSLIEMEANQYRRLTKEKQLHDQGVIHSLRWIVMKHELERGLLEDQLKFFRQKLELF